jgi:hypothetical protein
MAVWCQSVEERITTIRERLAKMDGKLYIIVSLQIAELAILVKILIGA